MRQWRRAQSHDGRWLINAMKGASLTHWQSLADFAWGSGSTLQVYNPELGTTSKCPPSVPWPVQWLLSGFSKKHIFAGNSPPPIRAVQADLEDFTNKQKWAWIHRHHDSNQCSIKVKGIRTPRCTMSIDPDINNFLIAFRSRVLGNIISMRGSRSNDVNFNLFPLLRMALRSLQRIPWVLIPNDKERGFCLVSHSDFMNINKSVLDKMVFSSPVYRPVRQQDADFRGINNSLRSLAKRIGSATDDPGIARVINKSSDGCIVAQLGFTVKTHKGQGSIGVRNLHKTPQYALRGLSAWVSHELSSTVPDSFTVRDSLEFKRRMEGVVCKPNSRLITMDIKDFYMSGLIDDLLSDCLELYDGDHALLVKEALSSLLSWQFITPCLADGLPIGNDDGNENMINVQLFRVLQGSGMGLPHSGTVASASFHKRVESKISFQRFGIQTMTRFHDDMFFVIDSAAQATLLLSFMQSVAKHFIITCSACSSSCVQFLDLSVSIVSNKINVRPSLHKIPCPLHVDSAHAPHVHNAWPHSLKKKVRALAFPDSACAAEKLLNQYRAGNASQHTLRIMSSSSSSSSPPQLSSNLDLSGTTHNIQVERPKFTWLSMGGHPVLFRCMNRVLRNSSLPFVMNPIRICWRNTLPNLQRLIFRANSSKLGKLKQPVKLTDLAS